MYSGSLDLFRLNPRPKIVKAKTSFKPNTHNFPEISTPPTKNPPKTAQSPGHPHFCNIPAAGLDPEVSKGCWVSRPQQPSADPSHGIPPCFSTDFPIPHPFLPHPNLAPIRSSCCTWSSCGNKPKSKGHGVLCWFWRTFCHQANCELRGCCSWRLAAAISPSNIFEFNVFAVSLPMFASHPFLRSFIMGNDAKTKINSSRCLKR